MSNAPVMWSKEAIVELIQEELAKRGDAPADPAQPAPENSRLDDLEARVQVLEDASPAAWPNGDAAPAGDDDDENEDAPKPKRKRATKPK